MSDYPEALMRLRAEARPLAQEQLPIAKACGRVAAERITAPMPVPPFANSAMDGYALNSAAFSGNGPWHLRVCARLAAGESAAALPANDACIEIMTGAPLPAGCDTVIPVEAVEHLPEPIIRVREMVAAGANIRRAGEDFIAGTALLEPGTRVSPNHLAVLASAGISTLAVIRQPRVVTFSTGLEVLPLDAVTRSGAQIYDSNAIYLSAMLEGSGIPVIHAGGAGDDKEAFSALLERHRDCEVLISTGAVSKGARDFIPQALAGLGATPLFHKVAIKPGKPVFAARMPDGRFFFGLPGNPVAVAVGLRFFVEPLLRALLGMPPEQAICLQACAGGKKKPGLRHFLKAAASPSGLTILPGQESFRLLPMTAMTGWAILPETTSEWAVGEAIAYAEDRLLIP